MDQGRAAYRQLDVWHVAMDLAAACHRATQGFPSREWFGLASQMRRAAASIPANIAEGYCRRSRASYAHHISIALGSHAELETQIELAVRLELLDNQEARRLGDLVTRAGQLLSALHRSLRRVRTPESRVPSPESRERT